MTITEFLLARIAEDEALAKTDGDWAAAHSIGCGHDQAEMGSGFCQCSWPARMQAECMAKRRIVELHKPVEPEPCHCGEEHGPKMTPACITCGTAQDLGLCDTIRALLAIYADHPDYDPEWRVE